MSWSIELIGRDKEKLKAAVRVRQCQDPVGNPHAGVPVRVADHLCNEVDRIRIYQYEGRSYGVRIKAAGSFHEQGSNETCEVQPQELIE